MIGRYLKSFRYALEGISSGFRTQKHFRFHVLATVLVLALAAYLRVSKTDWVLLLLCCGAVLAAELLNASIEQLANKVEPRIDPLIKDTKDLAAGAVLVVSVIAFIAGLIIFLPYFF